MAKEKRTKPCSNCKKSKVKCIYNNQLPCERCVKSGQAVTCQFVPKLPSLKLPGIRPQNNNSPPNNKPAEDITLPSLKQFSSSSNVRLQQPQSTAIMNPEAMFLVQQPQEQSESMWKSKIENRINTFDDKLSDLVDILKTNQKLILQNQMYGQNSPGVSHTAHRHANSQHARSPQISSLPPSRPYSPTITNVQHPEMQSIASSQLSNPIPSNSVPEEGAIEPSKKKQRITSSINDEFPNQLPDDFREGFLTKEDARVLFEFFNSNISQQLFGFDISKISVNNVWESSPILVCAICTIASMHHPDEKLSKKSSHLQNYLHSICGKLIYQGKPKNELEGFNTIVALVLCSFWLSDAQMFTGLALQFAKEIGLNSPMKTTSEDSSLTSKDKLKLWYLLYVLDGQQSLTFNRESLVNHNDYSLIHSRNILLPENEKEKIENGETPRSKSLINPASMQLTETLLDKKKQQDYEKYQRITDMRLVSQVEYNQALSEVFKGNAWDLISPSALGIPSKTNLELDKWMVSWTVLLSPGSVGTVWSSKSTLIYYNFAKMHINSSAIRQLEIEAGSSTGLLPKWKSSAIENESFHGPQDNEDSDSSDDEEFISNKQFLSEDKRVVDASIAINAARTVLNLVLSDNDILNNLKYVPVHIHIMLYYAALLLINPPLESNNRSEKFNPEHYYSTVAGNLVMVCKLQQQIYMNLPTDKNFGERLIKTLDDVISDKLFKIRSDLNDSLNDLDDKVKATLMNQLDAIKKMRQSDPSSTSYDKIISIDDSDSGKGKISAWPGSDHGHP